MMKKKKWVEIQKNNTYSGEEQGLTKQLEVYALLTIIRNFIIAQIDKFMFSCYASAISVGKIMEK